MKELIIPTGVTVLAFIVGLLFGALIVAEYYKERAIKHGAAHYVIQDRLTGTTRFEWINPEVER